MKNEAMEMQFIHNCEQHTKMKSISLVYILDQLDSEDKWYKMTNPRRIKNSTVSFKRKKKM